MSVEFSKGILAIDKPAGITSFDVIRVLRRLTGIRKIGHTGTLDPFAEGLLICLLGSYTRLASLGEAQDKSYLATVKLGESTTTGDPEGEINARAAVPAVIADPQSIINAALNLHELPVPAHSAIKINGTRAYEYARKNQEITMPIRFTRISSFDLIPWESGALINSGQELRYRCTVSKGTYIRSLSQWLATQLGTVGYTISLRRTSIGRISINAAVALATLSPENWQSYLKPPQIILDSFPHYITTETQELLIKNGNPIFPEPPLPLSAKPVALYSASGALLALAQQGETSLKPYLVIP